MHEDAERPAGPHCQRRLDTERFRHDLIAGARRALLRGLAQRLDKIAFTLNAELGANPEQAGEQNAFEERASVPVDAVADACVAGSIRGGHVAERDRSTARHDQSFPDDTRAALSESDRIIVASDKPRALRNEKNASSRCIVDTFGHLRCDETGKVGVQTGEQLAAMTLPALSV